jgi:predicted Fe-Mo cluster-binding NifX family protein
MNGDRENRVRIAIPTDDGINIFAKMLGMAKYMFIYEIAQGTKFRLIEKRDNPYAATMQHLKTLDVYEILSDCDIIISANIGKRGIKRLREKGMELVFNSGNIREALQHFVREGL